jgi:sirohydrochlorin cobaltochelatase
MATGLAFAIIAAVLAMSWPRRAAASARGEDKPAIALAAFGTTAPEAARDLDNIARRVAAAFPGYDVRLCFTSNMVRRVWRGRAAEAKAAGRAPHPYSSVKSPLSVLADLQEEGPRTALVQSLHVTDGEEYANLASLVAALSRFKPFRPGLEIFRELRLGAPALGLSDGDPARLDRAAKALGPLLDEAAESSAALVLMGHGNENLGQGVFKKLEERLRRGGRKVHVGTVEGGTGAAALAEALSADPPPSGKVVLAPLMVVAGDHARNDMAGPGPESWKSLLASRGLSVEARLAGLGSIDSWADIYVESLRELAKA